MIGHDYLFWLVPTYPLLNINYFERLYTYKQIERLPKFEEEEYDIDKKHFAKLKKYTEWEKMLFLLLLLVGIALYIAACKYFLF